MANIVAAATGNFTAAGTWGAVDSTSELDSEAGSTAISTSNLDSSAFTPGAVTVDAIALKLAARAASPSGTFTVTLRNSTAGVDIASVTVNVADLPSAGLGWQTFKFASSQLLLGATNYVVRVVCSATGSQVTLFRNGTSNNWSRKLRTTTTQAPASGNHIVISNELTGAGASNALTVTMDNTATTSFGPTVSGGPPQGIVISGGGTLTFGVAASTAYYLKWKGVLMIAGGGTVNVGTSGAQIPTTSTIVLEMDSVANVDSGIEQQIGGTLNVYGPPKTIYTLMTANASAGATSLTVGSTSGWEAGDVLGFAPTETTGSADWESKAISSVGGATAVTVAALTTAKKGAAPYQGEIVNLTQRIKIRGVSTSLRGYMRFYSSSVTHMEYFEFYQMGASTTNKQGLQIETTTGSISITFGSVHDGNSGFINWLNFASGATNVTYSNNIHYNIVGQALNIPANMGAAWTFDSNVWIGVTDNGDAFTFNVVGAGVFKNNRFAGSTGNGANAITFAAAAGGPGTTLTGGAAADWQGNVVHNVGVRAVHFSNTNGLNFGNLPPSYLNFWLKDWVAWHCCLVSSTALFEMNGCVINGLTLENPQFYGADNNAANIRIGGNEKVWVNRMTILGGAISGSTVASIAIGMLFGTACGHAYIELYGTTFGATATGRTVHGTADIQISSGCVGQIQIVASAAVLSSTTPLVGFQNGNSTSDKTSACFEKYGGTVADHRSFFRYGTIKTDSAIVSSTTPSVRLTPNNATGKLLSGSKIIPVTSGATRTVSVSLRKSASGDGAAYNGNQPRLMVKRNDAVGITADTVLATYSSSTGSFNTISGTTVTVTDDGAIECYVDCDGTAGWINIEPVWQFS